MRPYYQADGITIYHGDATDVLAEIGAIDCLLTDPPYGLGDRWTGGGSWQQSLTLQAAEWDAAPYPHMAQLIARSREAIVWGGNYYAMPPSRCWLAWDKIQKMDTVADFELAWTSFDRCAKSWTSTRNRDGKRVHPTQKPVALMRWCISFFGEGIIVDPFAGSGTTLVAARDLGRRAIGIEMREDYCKIMVDRLRQMVMFGEDE